MERSQELLMGKGSLFYKWCWESNEIGPLSYNNQKINSKWVKNLNIRHDTIKLLEGNVGKKRLNICFGNNISDMTPQAQATKADDTKFKSFCRAKETCHQIKTNYSIEGRFCKPNIK